MPTPRLLRLKVMAVRVFAVEVVILGSELTILDLFVIELIWTHNISPPSPLQIIPLHIDPPKKPYDLR